MMSQLLLLCLALIAPTLGRRLPYIIGGEDASISDFPWQCSLGCMSSSSYSHGCGASVISSTWLLTAAHCIGSASGHGVRCGSSKHASGGVTRSLNQLIVHENYGEGPGAYPNDIALLAVDALTLGGNVQAIIMATADQTGNPDCWITGWGYTTVSNNPRPLANILQKALVKVYTNDDCKENWGSSVNDGHVCVGNDDKTRGSCNGDSGGPLVCKVETEYQLLGVTSWGNRDCHPRDLSAYARVPYFREWVRGKTGI